MRVSSYLSASWIAIDSNSTGLLDTFRQLKKDITEARKGVECGMSLKDYSDLQAGDIIQMYDTIEKPGVL